MILSIRNRFCAPASGVLPVFLLSGFFLAGFFLGLFFGSVAVALEVGSSNNPTLLSWVRVSPFPPSSSVLLPPLFLV